MRKTILAGVMAATCLMSGRSVFGGVDCRTSGTCVASGAGANSQHIKATIAGAAYCALVTNGSSRSVFVPYNSLAEWNSFFNATTPLVTKTVVPCTVAVGTVPPQWFGNVYWNGANLTAYPTGGAQGCYWAPSAGYPVFSPGVPSSQSPGYVYWPCACCATGDFTSDYDGTTIHTYGGNWAAPFDHWVTPDLYSSCSPGYSRVGNTCVFD